MPVATILAAYDKATHAADVTTFAAEGTLNGEGLTGTYRIVRDGRNEREDDVLGPRHETSLRLGDRLYVRNANGNVRELKGFLRRRALTEDLLDSGAFIEHPELSRFVGWGDVGGTKAWRLEVDAKGGEPETLWIDSSSGLPLRLEYLDGDGPSFVDYSDWRDVKGRKIAFRNVVSDGDHRFDTVQQTTSVTLDEPVDPANFAPLAPRLLATDRVHTVPLIEREGHVGVTVRIANKDWFFLLDTGAQSILVDSAVLQAAGVTGEGAMEVRGAARSGGLTAATLPRLEIDGAAMDDVVVSSIDIGRNLGGGLKIDGILGYPFFASAVVEMDFAKHLMRFGPPGSFAPQGTAVALDVDRELAEATLMMNGHLDAPFIVDTGNSGEMLLYRPFLDAHPGIVPFSATASWNYGIGGANATYRTSLDDLKIGGVDLYRRTVDVVLANQGAFADRVDAGNVGLGVLSNFVATFDLGNATMYLAPGIAFDDGRRRTARM
ncbi:MAG: aspartyl protease family protein [Candidatus Eremiobacteraeota bacterium]|nr:aspartyl protease family protein [Candidatus Eremiobacteraeota bacterium]